MSGRPLPPLLALSLIGLLCLIWGSTWLVIKQSLLDLPPFTSVAARVLVAAVVMLLVAGPLHRLETGSRPPLWLSAQLGGIQFALSYAIIYWAERVLPSGLCSVLWAVYPLLIALAGHFWLASERITPRQGLGFLLGFCGIVALFLTDVRGFGPDAVPTALVLLVSPLVVTVSTLLIKKHGSGMSSILLNRDGLCFAAVLLVGWVAAVERDAPVTWTPRAILAVLYLAIVGTVITFCLYFWLMRSVAAYRMSLIAYVTPALALALGVLVGGETVHWHTLAGGALVLVGVGLSATKGKPPVPDT